MYSTGYNGRVRTLDELKAWSEWQALDPEMGRRVLAMLDDSKVAGRPLGLGGIFRTYTQQRDLFLSRHHVVVVGGCCTFDGKRYALNAKVAHAAPPGRSYHEATTPDGKGAAIDFTGDLTWLAANCARYGLNQFGQVNREPWHSQPAELPNARSRYDAKTMHPLRVFPLHGKPTPAPVRVFAPTPTLRQRTKADVFGGRTNDTAQVRSLQHLCNFWGWRDTLGRTLIVDGDFGAKTAQAVMAMQAALQQTRDGQYGPRTAAALQRFLDAMVQVAA